MDTSPKNEDEDDAKAEDNVTDIVSTHLLKTRKVFIIGEVSDATIWPVIKSLKYLVNQNKDPIYIYISSDGGEVEPCMALIDEILGLRSQKIEISTICCGRAYSAGAFILSMGTPGYRYITRNSTVMLHPVGFAMPHDYVGFQKEATDFTDKFNDHILKLVATACGKKYYSKFKTLIQKSLWLNAKQAISFGIVDGYWDYSWELS